jgi:hydroxymethylbilane synthase
MANKQIIIGSRGSKLALWQAELVKSLLYKSNPDLRIEIKIIKTQGDKILDTPLAKIGDKGLFTKEIEEALLENKIDLAVHSMKDLPTKLPDQLIIGAVLERENPRDAFVSLQHNQFADLPEKAVVATSSLRRKACILHQRPDIQIVDIRGNVDTRLRKLKQNNYDGTILATAGLIRLNLDNYIKEVLSTEIMLPAVSQGALGIEIRENDDLLKYQLKPLHDQKTYFSILAERALLRKLEGGCQVPIGALATIKQNKLTLRGFVSDLTGSKFYRSEISGKPEKAEEIGELLAENLIEQGAQEVLDEIYREQRK